MDRETITMMTPHPVTNVNANLLLTNKTDSDLNLLRLLSNAAVLFFQKFISSIRGLGSFHFPLFAQIERVN